MTFGKRERKRWDGVKGRTERLRDGKERKGGLRDRGRGKPERKGKE